MHTLKCGLETTTSIEQTFAVFQNPYNLARITPPWLKFEILTPDVEMREGARIEYLFRWLGVPLRWETRITRYEPPFYFVDEAVKSPYTVWRHHHTFQETSSGIVVADRVDYQLPFGPFGRVVHRAAVEQQLLRIFNFRQTAILDLLGGQVIEQPTITWS